MRPKLPNTGIEMTPIGLRPNVATTRDPLNHSAMPPIEELELDYRIGGLPHASYAAIVIPNLFIASIVGIAVLAVLRVAGLVHILTSPFVLACVVVVCSVGALFHFVREAECCTWITWLAAGPTIWFLIILTDGAGQFLICLPPIALATYVAHALVRHYGAWAHANPHLAQLDRRAWLRIWVPGTYGDLDAPAGFLNEATEQAEHRRYRWGFAVVVFAAGIAMLTYTAQRPFAGLVALTIFVTLLVLYGVINILDYRGRRLSLWGCLACSWRAVLSWATYNHEGLYAPGVFLSPCGDNSHRRGMLFLAIAALAATVVPLAAYFPVPVLASPPDEWIRAAAQPLRWINDAGDHGPQLPAPPTRDQVLARLTQVQRAYLDQLPSERHRRAYLNQVATTQYQATVTAAIRPAFERLTSTPEFWLLVAANQVANGNESYLWALLFSGAATLLAGPVVFLSICFALGGRVLAHFDRTLEVRGAPYHRRDTDSAWESYQRRLAESDQFVVDGIMRVIRERDHLFVGLHSQFDYPILLHQSILAEHAHITGDSGSGKSALGIPSLLTQLTGRPGSSIVVIDLKGDRALFECARLEAERHHIPFRWVTNSPRHATFAFNPFLQKHMQQISRVQLAEVLLKSLGLEYGEGYGRSYFSSLHRDVLTKMLDQYPEINSFRTLQQYLSNAREFIDITREQRERGTHLLTTVNMLSTMDALNVAPNNGCDDAVFANRIDMSDVIARPQVVYFYLHAQLQETTMREVAKLALHSLLTAAILDKNRDHQVYLFVDEFQQIVSADLEIVLRMARDSGIAAILCNQTISDLVTQAADLRPTVQANTRYKQIFSATDLLQQDDVIKSSGEALYAMFSVSQNAHTRTSSTESIGPRLRRNDVIETSDCENLSIAHVSRGRGYTQFGGFPFPMYTAFHIPYDEYVRRRKKPWPLCKDHPGTFVPPTERRDVDTHTPAAKPPPAAAQVRPSAPDEIEKGRIDDIGTLLDDM